MDRDKPSSARLAKGSEGAAVVEFAIVLNLFMILIFGMIDFGHAWFMRQIAINASREGARYGVVYTVPKRTVAEIQVYVKDRMKSSGLKDSEISDPVITGAQGATETPLTVSVTVTKTWWVINKFLPFLGGDTFPMTVATVMRNE